MCRLKTSRWPWRSSTKRAICAVLSGSAPPRDLSSSLSLRRFLFLPLCGFLFLRCLCRRLLLHLLCVLRFTHLMLLIGGLPSKQLRDWAELYARDRPGIVSPIFVGKRVHLPCRGKAVLSDRFSGTGSERLLHRGGPTQFENGTGNITNSYARSQEAG